MRNFFSLELLDFNVTFKNGGIVQRGNIGRSGGKYLTKGTSLMVVNVWSSWLLEVYNVKFWDKVENYIFSCVCSPRVLLRQIQHSTILPQVNYYEKFGLFLSQYIWR